MQEGDIRLLAIQDRVHKRPNRTDEKGWREMKPDTEREQVKVFVVSKRMTLTIYLKWLDDNQKGTETYDEKDRKTRGQKWKAVKNFWLENVSLNETFRDVSFIDVARSPGDLGSEICESLLRSVAPTVSYRSARSGDTIDVCWSTPCPSTIFHYSSLHVNSKTQF